MITLDIFDPQNPAWSTTNLTGWINNRPSIPSMVRNMNLYEEKPITSQNFMIDQEDNVLKLIGFSERGGDLTQHKRGSRKSIGLTVPRLGVTDIIEADTLAGLRSTGTVSDLKTVQGEVQKLLGEMSDNMDYTDEYLQLAGLQGKVLNPADGSVYADAFVDMGVTPAANVVFNFTDETFKVKRTLEELVIDVKRSAKGAWVEGRSRLRALVGDDFWFGLTGHPEVKDWHRGHGAMVALMNLDPTDEFYYGGVVFKRYTGSDDNAEIAIPVNEAKFFVEGGRDIFIKAMAPASEHTTYVNTRGVNRYVIPKYDSLYKGNERWMGFDLVSYPLYWCQRPNTLRTATST